MLGRHNFAPKLYYQLSLDRLVPKDHLLCRIASAIDFSFARPYYSHTGQPSVDPVVLFKVLSDWVSLRHHLGKEADGRSAGESGLPVVSGV